VPSVYRFEFVVLGGKLRDALLLNLKRTTHSGSGGPVYEPLVKDGSLSLGDGAGIDYAGVCELLISDQEERQLVQHVVIIAENLANVVCCRITVFPPDFLQDGRKFHQSLPSFLSDSCF